MTSPAPGYVVSGTRSHAPWSVANDDAHARDLALLHCAMASKKRPIDKASREDFLDLLKSWRF